MGDEVFWLFEARVKPGKRAEFEETVAELVQVADGEPGTLGYQWSVDEEDGAVVREHYASSEAALTHLRGFEENWLDRMLTLVEPIGTTVWGDPSEELRAELGDGTSFHTALGGFSR
jgi:quinol monooxygenase YgiN